MLRNLCILCGGEAPAGAETDDERVMSLYERIGGDKLRAVLTDFYDRVFADIMIGFLFVGKDKQRLIDKEWEFTAALLGANVKYTGRTMREAHARSPILGGHFARRLQILRETLADHAVDEQVCRVWIEHTVALRPQVTADQTTECDHDLSAERLERLANRSKRPG